MRGGVLAAALILAGCGGGEAPSTNKTAGEACGDGGARLAQTGLCRAEAEALLVRAAGGRSPELPDCTWTVNELALPEGEVMLYPAATCGGETATLAFAGGAHSAEITYERSPLFGDTVADWVVIRLFSAPADNPQGALQAAIAEAPDAAAMECAIRPAGLEGWPDDALLLAPSPAARAKLPADEPHSFCGPLGQDENSIRYWRVRQGFAWFYDLGQEQMDIDAASATIVTRGPDGAWVAKE